MTRSQEELSEALEELIERHGVPGAQLAVMDGDQLVEVAAGVLSLRTGCPVTPAALFLPGSIGKLYTATLVLMLVGEGKLDLDTTVRTYLPDFRVQDESALEVVTLRNLLTHTSGFDGDHFVDTGRGDDALALYVAGCKDLPQIADPGKIWSYSNSGYAILGRVVEVVTGQSFETVLREQIFGPLGLEHTVSFAEEVVPHPASVGHVADPEQPGELMVSPVWALYRAFGPMGAAVVASAGDVLRFAGLHLSGGLAPDGSRLLAAGLVAEMQAVQVRLVDDSLLGGGWGLGWNLDRWGDVELIGHDGNSIGQNAFMRLAPGERFGFCLQTNVESALGLYLELAAWLFEERLGVAPRAQPVALENATVSDAGRYVGVYEREGLRLLVGRDESGGLNVTVEPSHDVEGLEFPPMIELPLQPVGLDDSFLLKLPIADTALLAVFFNPDDPRALPTYLHFGGRAHRRAA